LINSNIDFYGNLFNCSKSNSTMKHQLLSAICLLGGILPITKCQIQLAADLSAYPATIQQLLHQQQLASAFHAATNPVYLSQINGLLNPYPQSGTMFAAHHAANLPSMQTSSQQNDVAAPINTLNHFSQYGYGLSNNFASNLNALQSASPFMHSVTQLPTTSTISTAFPSLTSSFNTKGSVVNAGQPSQYPMAFGGSQAASALSGIPAFEQASGSEELSGQRLTPQSGVTNKLQNAYTSAFVHGPAIPTASESSFTVQQIGPPIAFRPSPPSLSSDMTNNVNPADSTFNDQTTLRRLSDLADEEDSLSPDEIERRADAICNNNPVCEPPSTSTAKQCSDTDYYCQFVRVCGDCYVTHRQKKCLDCLRLKLIPSNDKPNQIKVACKVCGLTANDPEQPKICKSMKCPLE